MVMSMMSGDEANGLTKGEPVETPIGVCKVVYGTHFNVCVKSPINKLKYMFHPSQVHRVSA